jgi:hypothetical protein
VYDVTRKARAGAIKKRSGQLVGSALDFDVPEKAAEAKKKRVLPDEVTV